MTDEYRAKVFKSGNSLALRLPKALGIEEGAEMRVREDHGRYIFEPAPPVKRKVDVAKFWGKAPWLKPLTREDREVDHSPRVWDDPDWTGWKNDSADKE